MIFFKATKMQRQKPKEQSKKDQKAESIAGQNATTMTNNTMAGCQTICFHITHMSKVKADRIEPSQIFSCKMKGKEGIRMGSIFPHSFPCKRKECVHWSTSPHQVFPSSECQTQRIQLKERLVGGELDENWTHRNISALIIVRMEP